MQIIAFQLDGPPVETRGQKRQPHAAQLKRGGVGFRYPRHVTFGAIVVRGEIVSAPITITRFMTPEASIP